MDITEAREGLKQNTAKLARDVWLMIGVIILVVIVLVVFSVVGLSLVWK